MLHVAICDDDLLFAQQVRNQVKKTLGDNRTPCQISIFQNGESLMSAGFFDLVFLDIEMQGLNGLETAERLREQGNFCRIIFLTSHKKYVFSAFDVSASHYLVKPVEEGKLEAVLIKVVQELSAEKEECYLLKQGVQFRRIPFSQIQYVEVFGRKITLHVKRDIYSCNGRLEELQQAFPRFFFRCHKSYLVNLSLVVKYDKEKAVLQSGETVPIARRKFLEFGTAFLAFLQEEEGV